MFIGNFVWIRLKRQKEEDNLDIQPSKVKNHKQHVEFLQKYVKAYCIYEKE